jgi:hypothetical protein
VAGNAVVIQFLLESWNELSKATILVGSTMTRHQLSETASRNSITKLFDRFIAFLWVLLKSDCHLPAE